MKTLLKLFVSAFYRPADREIKVNGKKYLRRWHVIPRNRFFNIYLHCFLASDDDRALHDHPWSSVSFLLKGEIVEHTQDFGYEGEVIDHRAKIKRLIPKYRTPKHAHRIELVSVSAWTIFITSKKVRTWGFYCPNKWVPWRQFTDSTGNQIGAGCGQ